MTEQKKLQFEASAYLQRLIGRELISTDELAVIELVKNAYDAGATSVTITIRPPSDREPGEISILDDGEGMSLDALRRVFMYAGYSDRPGEVDKALRVPTGEKGIGRFAADKLGQNLTVITRTSDAAAALRVEIDWNLFNNRRKRFSDIKVPYKTDPGLELRGAKRGTLLKITQLRGQWERDHLKRLRDALGDLLDPFDPPKDFQIELQVPGSEKLSGEIVPQQITKYDIELQFKVLKSGKVKRTLRGTVVKEAAEETGSRADTGAITGLEGKFLYYLKLPKKDFTKGYSAGVRLYRDGFRVEPLGRSSADWLGVAEKRAKRAGHAHVVPSRLFGFVSISRTKHPELRHTTSREALLEGEAVQAMVTFLREQLDYLETNIRTEVAEPRWKESQVRQVAERERSRLQTLSIMSVGLAHEVRQPLQAIRSEAENINERLKQLGVTDEDIKDAQENIDANIERIDKNIQMVAAISSGSLEHVENIDLASFVRDQGEFLRPRCEIEQIELSLKLPPNQPSRVNTATVTTVLFNLVQNAIDELRETNGDRKRKIVVSLSKTKETNVLEVTDNGRGIDEEIRQKLFKRFASKKTGGWGVGLYNCQLLIQSHGGSLTVTSRNGLGTTFRMELPNAKG